MKNFFQRRQDTRPNPNAPTNDQYKVWLPPPDTRAAPRPPAPTGWINASAQGGVRPSGEKHRSSSRARADASSVPASSAYKYATVPGFYYPSNPAQTQPFPPQYYPPGGLDRPDSRLGYVPYPYPHPQYPQSFAAAPASSSQPPTSKAREDKRRNDVNGRGSRTVPAPAPAPAPAPGRPSSSRKHSEKDDGIRAPRPSSSSSMREQKREDGEVKRPKHRTREPSETRKRRDSKVGDSHTENYRDKSSRKESRQNPRVEEGDSSDSSIQRPLSSAGYRRPRSRETNKPQQEAIPFPAGSRAGFPVQPTAASSSSGKHTPQIPRMPVYLPPSHPRRPDEGQPGLSESDTDHGTLKRGRNFLRGTAMANAKRQSKPPAVLPEPPPTIDKKIKESKGLWPFSRSKSSQKLPQTVPNASTATIPPTKIRAESTPTKVPQFSVEGLPTGHPEYRRHASDNAIGSHPYGFSTPAPQESRSRPAATQPNEFSSRPMATASQQAALHSLRSRNDPPAVDRPPATVASSVHRQNPPLPTGALHGQGSGATVGPQILRPETPLRRDKSNLPLIYAPATATRTSDYPHLPDRSTTPKVSQLVAGFEARSSEQPHVSQQVANPAAAARRAVVEKSSLPQIYAPQQSSQGTGGTSTSTRRPANSHVVASQPPVGAQPVQKRDEKSHAHGRPVESSNVQARPVINQPDVLKTQLRDLLTDKHSASRSDEKVQARGLPPELRVKQASTPPTFYQTAKPPDWNPTSQLYAFAQPPVQVYTAGTSSTPLKFTAKSEKPAETPSLSNPAPAGSSKRPHVSQSDSVDRTSRGGVTRAADDVRDVDRVHRPSSRPKKDPIAVMKTPSKDSSRHTSSPSPVLLTHSSNPSRSNDKAQNAASQTPSTSRSQPHIIPPDVQHAGRHEPSSFALNVPQSSSFLGDKAAHRDHRSASTTFQSTGKPQTYDGPLMAPNAPPPMSSLSHSEGSRLPPSASTRPFPNNQALPVPSNIPPVRPSSRSAASPSTLHPMPEVPPALLPQSSTRSSLTPGSSSNSRTVPRAPSDESLLKTPSSLAPSVLHRSASRNSIPASFSSETRKKGIFGMFRSKAAQQSQTPAFDVRHPAPSAKDGGAHLSPEVVAPQETAHPADSDRKSKNKIPPPITIPNPALPISDRKSPNSRVFTTPFRYLTNKRNRRISTASMDAEDGTAPNTVMGSPTASMQSSQIPTQSPPQRDPRIATQDWRNQEESEVKARGKPRRMRPGVVFDVAEDPLEETKRSRPARTKKAQPLPTQSAEPPTTDSSDA